MAGMKKSLNDLTTCFATVLILLRSVVKSAKMQGPLTLMFLIGKDEKVWFIEKNARRAIRFQVFREVALATQPTLTPLFRSVPELPHYSTGAQVHM